MVKRTSTKKSSGRFKKGWILLLSLIITALIIAVSIIFFEGKKPVASLGNIPSSIGKNTTINLLITDEGRGLKEVHFYLYKDTRELVLKKEIFNSKSFFAGSGVNSHNLFLKINPEQLGIKDGIASLRLLVKDCSWRSFFKGNKIYLQKDILIDTTAPRISVLSRKHYLSPGGTGLVCYKVSELDCESGVMVGEEFFPGYSGFLKDPHYKLAFFALDHLKKNNKPLFIKAVDKAGNLRKAGFPYYIKKKKFKKDRINITDNFLSWKMPEFDLEEGIEDPVKKFLHVNSKVRKDNMEELTNVSLNTDNKKYWKGSFLQLRGSANRAGFADHRSYYYNGRKIDEAFHMGLDLASYTNAPVPAANSGKIADVKRIGIFGLNVTIDHGFGLFSNYSHLSQADVKVGELVKKGDIIGRTGTSGLAGGDHLHFGVFVHNRFVNPIEWFDPNWIKNNIGSKLELIKSYE